MSIDSPLMLLDQSVVTSQVAGAQHTGATTAPSQSAPSQSETSQQSATPAEKPSVFTELLEHLADSHELHFDPIGHVELPYIFWDSEGTHFFSGEHALVANPAYTVGLHGKPLRKDGKPISLDMSPTGNVFFMMLSAVILFVVVRSAANKSRKSLVPTGLRNLVEVLIVFIRDEVVYPSCNPKYAEPLMPFFLTIFFFILMMNLIGLVPFGHTATGAVSVTAALAICTFFVTQVIGVRAMGMKNYLKHLTGGLLDMDIPIVMKILLTLIMVPIEIMGLFTKPFALAVRLFANMTAGHIVIVSLIGLAFLFKSVVVGAFVSVPFALFINLLELLVALLQAYIFTMLSALFIGMMAHDEHDHEEAHVEHAHA